MVDVIEESKFYLNKETVLTKTVKYYDNEGRIGFALDGDEVDEKIYKKAAGNITFTLLIPSWWLKNHIRSKALTMNMVGVNSVDQYSLNNNIIVYLLKGWTVDKKLDFEMVDGIEIIKDSEILLKSNINSFVFDSIIWLYNRFIA
jgi:hypothetical protein